MAFSKAVCDLKPELPPRQRQAEQRLIVRLFLRKQQVRQKRRVLAEATPVRQPVSATQESQRSRALDDRLRDHSHGQ